jgi:pimeloyl-ACP methyl ester carboxylesterase
MYFKIKGTNKDKQVLLIHGWSHSSSVWDKIIDELSKKYQVIVIDLLGHGNSGAPEFKGNLLDLLSKTLYELIKKENWNLYGIISHSMGGLIALKILKEYGLTINKLMIIGTPYCGLPKWVSTVGKMDKLVKHALSNRSKLPEKMSRFVSKIGSKITVGDLSTIHENLYLAIEKGNPEYLSRLFKELATNCFSLEKPLNVKSIIISRGENDLLTSRENLIKLARILKGEYYQFKNVSHTVPIESPNELKRLVFKLLD